MQDKIDQVERMLMVQTCGDMIHDVGISLSAMKATLRSYNKGRRTKDDTERRLEYFKRVAELRVFQRSRVTKEQREQIKDDLRVSSD